MTSYVEPILRLYTPLKSHIFYATWKKLIDCAVINYSPYGISGMIKRMRGRQIAYT